MTVEEPAPAALRPSFEDVATTQKSCSQATENALEAALQLVQEACESIEAGHDAGEVVQALNGKLKAQKFSKVVANATHEFHDAIKKVGKVRAASQHCRLDIDSALNQLTSMTHASAHGAHRSRCN